MKKILTNLPTGFQIGLLAATLALLLGCKTTGDQMSYAAVITQPSADSLVQITKAVSTALDGQSVKIAEDALSTTNQLIIVTNTQSRIGNDPINGRIQERPQHFYLMQRGSECYLLHDETAKEYVLQDVTCQVLESDAI